MSDLLKMSATQAVSFLSKKEMAIGWQPFHSLYREMVVGGPPRFSIERGRVMGGPPLHFI